MEIDKKFDTLETLTMEADMLSGVINDALKAHENIDGIADIAYVSEILRKKFDKIRDLFW